MRRGCLEARGGVTHCPPTPNRVSSEPLVDMSISFYLQMRAKALGVQAISPKSTCSVYGQIPTFVLVFIPFPLQIALRLNVRSI